MKNVCVDTLKFLINIVLYVYFVFLVDEKFYNGNLHLFIFLGGKDHACVFCTEET